LELLCHPLVGGDDFVEGVGDLALNPDVIAGHPHREIARAHRLQRMQEILQRIGLSVDGGLTFGSAANGG
ncbi:hypothetical protein ACO1GT_14170, partial [Staphylococcus arlettae]